MLLPALPASLPAAVVIVQHPPAGFTRPLAERLDRMSRPQAREARDGDALARGVALVAPGGRHLAAGGDTVSPDDGPRRRSAAKGVVALRRVQLAAVQPGMRLAQSIRDVHGRLILAAPATLDEVSVGRLGRVGVESVQVEDPRFEGLDLQPVVSDRLMHDAVEMFAAWEQVLCPESGGKPRACVDPDPVNRLVGRLVDGMPLSINEPVWLVAAPSPERAVVVGAVNAARLAWALAPQVGLARHALDIAVGAFVRDIGLLLVDPGARALPPTGVPAEGSPQYRHAVVGLDCLSHPRLWSPVSKAVIAQHHERMNGGGYPCGLRGEAIHAPAALVAAIDVYCALVAPGNGEPGVTAEQAVDGVMSLAGLSLDGRCVQVLCGKVGLYAPGTVVRLNTGDEAVVVASGRGTHRRPCLRMVEGGQMLDLQGQDALGLQVVAVVEA